MDASEPRFLVDTMCGRLARWLRILGYDADWVRETERKRMVLRCLKEERVLLTRDRRYARMRGIQTLFLRSEKIGGQVRQILSDLKLGSRPERFFSRCSFCNSALVILRKEEAAEKVPPFVFAAYDGFYKCPDCRRIYWQGTHRSLFEEQLAAIERKEGGLY